MSNTIDSKVVEMRFDNSNFEKNVKQSMTTLDKLKQALKLDGAAKGLTAVEQRANSVRFHGLADTVDKIAEKFSGLEMIGTMAMIRITNAAANAGINLVKSLSVDNILAGWEKLQQKSNSVSTLLSQGYDMATVEQQMEKLNWFSDETSYNFTDMIDNISKFTAAGKGLTESTTAMQGIALWAAKSGQNAQKASFAMYQLSQALGAGQMRLVDWKSIQNANMDTVEFREQAIQAAIDLGKLKKVGEDTYKSLVGDKSTFHRDQFSESLSRGAWFTSDVMMEVYQRYGKGADQVKEIINTMDKNFGKDLLAMDIISAYKALNKLNKNGETFEDIINDIGLKGDSVKVFEEMISQLDKFGMSALIAGQEYRTFKDVIDATKDAVSTKWMTVFETILGNVEEQKELWSTIGEQFYEWFAEPIDRLQLKLAKWSALGGRKALFDAFGNIGAAIHSIVKPIKQAWKEIFDPITPKNLADMTEKFKNFTAQLKISGKTAESIKSVFRAIFSVIKTGLSIVKTLGSALFKLISVFKPLGELAITAVGFLGKWIDKTAEAARNSKWLSTTINNVVEGIKKFAEAVGSMIKKFLSYESFVKFFSGLFSLIKNIGLAIGKFIGGIIRNGDLNQVMKLINSGLISALLLKFQGVLKSFKQVGKEAAGILENIKGVLESYQKDINAKTLLKIASALAILVGSIWVLSSIDDAALAKGIGAITLVMVELMACFKVFTKFSKDQKILLRNSLALISLSASLLILSTAIKNLGSLNLGQMAIALGGLALAMQMFIHTIKKLPDDEKTKVKTKGLITLSLSLLILSVALKKMGNMKVTEIVKSLITMFFSLQIMTKAISKMNPEGAIKKTLSLLVLANAMLILGGALKILGSMSWKEIGRGLTALGGALGILVVMMNLLNNGNKSAMNIFGNNGFMSASSSSGGAIGKSFALLGATLSLVILGGALKILATMNWSDIGRSLTGMLGALAILVIAMKIMGSDAKSAFVGAGSLIIAANSLIALAMGLKILASIKPEKLVVALVSLAAALTILGVAGILLSKAALGLLAVAGATLLFSLAAVALGVGLGLIAAGISALALALSAGTTAIVAGVSAIILGIIGLIPEIVKTLGLAIAEFCKVIIKCAPLIAKALGTVLLEAVKMLKDFVPPIVTAILDLIIQTIRSVTDRVPELIMSIAELLSAIFKGFMEALQILDAKTLLGGIACIGMLAIIFQLLAGLAITAPLAALGVIAFGGLLIELMGILGIVAKFKNMINSIKDAGEVLDVVGKAIGRFIGGIISGFGLGISDFMPQIATNLSLFMTNLQPFLDGVNKVRPDTVIRLGSLVAGILVLTTANFIAGLTNISIIGDSLPKLGKNLSGFMKNAKSFIDGASVINPNITQGVRALAASLIMLTASNFINNLSNAFSVFTGSNSLSKFGEEIAKLGTSMKKFAKNLGKFSEAQVISIASACNAIVLLAKAAKEIPNEGGLWAVLVGDNGIGKWSGYLPKLGTNLNKFVKNLGAFTSTQTDCITAAGEAIVSLAKSAKQIPNEGGLWAVLVGDNSISQFASKLPLTGLCLALMAKALQGFTKDSVEIIEFAGQAIAALATAASKIPNSGGIVSLFTGDNDISLFAFKLPIVGKCLKEFSNKLGTFNEDDVNKSEFAGKAIAALATAASKIPNSYGLVNLFTGDNDISLFAFKLPGVATNLKSFVDNLGTFTEAQVTTTDCAGKAIKALATAAGEIPTTGGLSKLFTGESDISQFSDKFPGVATNLKSFVDNLGTFTEAQVTTTDCAGKAIKALGAAANDIPAEDGLWQKLAGKQSLADFSDDLPNVGSALANFVKNLSANGDFTSTQVSTIDAACNALKTLASVSNDFPKTGGVWQWLTGENDISKHSDKFPLVAKGLKGFTDKLKDYDETKVASVNAATQALNALAKVDDIDFSKLSESSEDMPSIGTNVTKFINKISSISQEIMEQAKTNTNAFVELLTNFSKVNGDNIKKISEGLKSIGNKGIENFIEALSGDSPKTKVSQAIRDLIIKLIDTMESKRVDVENKMISIVTSAVDKLNESNIIDRIKTAGKNFAQGFANGIENNRYLVIDAGTKLGNDAYNAAKKAIDAHSPSKKAYKLGGFFGQGFINGIHEYISDAYDESYNMADYANKGLNKAIMKVNDILSNDNVNQPVIRPILDLTNIEDNAKTISDVLNSEQSIGAMANINAISTNFNRNLQNRRSDEMLSAIKDLGKSLNNTGVTNNYNVNGVNYSGDSDVQSAIETLVRAVTVEGRV